MNITYEKNKVIVSPFISEDIAMGINPHGETLYFDIYKII